MENLKKAHPKEVKAFEELKKIIDPELNINIIDLGLIYLIEYKEGRGIYVEMTLTTPSCPVSGSLVEQVQIGLQKVFREEQIAVQLVWEPKWGPERISEEGLKILGWG